MTKDDVIRLVETVSLVGYIGNWGRVQWANNVYPQLGDDLYAGVDLIAFAKLVAEHEREACAKVCEEYETDNDIADTWLNIVSEVIRARGQT